MYNLYTTYVYNIMCTCIYTYMYMYTLHITYMYMYTKMWITCSLTFYNMYMYMCACESKCTHFLCLQYMYCTWI